MTVILTRNSEPISSQQPFPILFRGTREECTHGPSEIVQMNQKDHFWTHLPHCVSAHERCKLSILCVDSNGGKMMETLSDQRYLDIYYYFICFQMKELFRATRAIIFSNRFYSGNIVYICVFISIRQLDIRFAKKHT